MLLRYVPMACLAGLWNIFTLRMPNKIGTTTACQLRKQRIIVPQYYVPCVFNIIFPICKHSKDKFQKSKQYYLDSQCKMCLCCVICAHRKILTKALLYRNNYSPQNPNSHPDIKMFSRLLIRIESTAFAENHLHKFPVIPLNISSIRYSRKINIKKEKDEREDHTGK